MIASVSPFGGWSMAFIMEGIRVRRGGAGSNEGVMF